MPRKTKSQTRPASDNCSAIEDIAECQLHHRTPYVIQGVSTSHFSIARFYGGAEFNGEKYIYLEDTDELVRVDVMEWRNKRKVPSLCSLKNQ